MSDCVQSPISLDLGILVMIAIARHMVGVGWQTWDLAHAHTISGHVTLTVTEMLVQCWTSHTTLDAIYSGMIMRHDYDYYIGLVYSPANTRR